MPKFTLIKHRDTENDAEVSVTFTTDELGLAKDHFDDFMKASGFELPLDDRMAGYTVRNPSEWEWDDKGEFKIDDSTFGEAMTEFSDFHANLYADIITFPNRFDIND